MVFGEWVLVMMMRIARRLATKETVVVDEPSGSVQFCAQYTSRLLPIMGIDPGLSFTVVINFILALLF